MLLDGASCAEDCARQEGRVRLTGNQHGVPRAYLAVRLVVVGATMLTCLSHSGSRLKIVNTTVVFGSRIFSARTEVGQYMRQWLMNILRT